MRQPACLNCRRSKIRCHRDDALPCQRCKQADLSCVVPDHHLGRQKGVKNKRTGLEKALHQIEQAIKRPDADQVVSNLHDILARQGLQGLQGSQGSLSQQSYTTEEDSPAPVPVPVPVPAPAPGPGAENLALDDAENPLQLLARASDLQAAGQDKPDVETDTDTNAKPFFVPVRASRDIGPDLDPIDLGLVTQDESELLFSSFYQNLAHTRWGLDPIIHTPAFVRAQSAFLFTSILAAAALFLPNAALSKRLSRHCSALAHCVSVRRHRSVEIVLAFMVNVPWMAPGDCLGDDDTCAYIAMALTVALDLSLNKIVVPSSSSTFNPAFVRLARADCIDARRALQMDGFDVDVDSDRGRRLLRRRERAWIALFVLERGVCLARGRSYTVPPTVLVQNCDNWHISDIADPRDGPMNSMAVLRRNLDDLFRKVKSSCDSHQAAQSIKTMIERFYDEWYASWAPALASAPAPAMAPTESLPPYVDILVTHTRLSTYAGVINHPTAALEVKRFFRAAALSSALNVLRAAIQGESRLKSMPNNTVIMISFAACSALTLGVTPADSRSSLAPSVRNLIDETAGVLERIGATPSHRNGSSALYGKFLRELIRRQAGAGAGAGVAAPYQLDADADADADAVRVLPGPLDACDMDVHAQQPLSPVFLSEPLHFSAMSDNQIVDAINQAGSAFGTTVPDVPLEDMLQWDWTT